MDDLFQNPNDDMEVEPADLTPVFADVLAYIVAKNIASHSDKPWTDKHESEMQEKISALIAAANERGLKTLRVIVTRTNGVKVSQVIDIDRISKTRSLQ